MLTLFAKNRILRYCFNYSVFYGIVILSSIVTLPYILLHPVNVLNSLLTARLIRTSSWIIGLKYKIIGEEHLKEDRACVVISNHQSSFDFLSMCHLWPIMVKCTTVVKKEVLYCGPVGFMGYLCGTCFIDRSNPDKARATLDAALERIKEEKLKLWIYPEGTRNKTGKIEEFKKGAFYIAIKGQVPILPVVFSEYHFLSKSAEYSKKGQIIVTILPPISTKELEIKDITGLIEKTRSQMQVVYKSTSKETNDIQPS